MEDKILMPKSLTAENGAKYFMSGEFFEVVELECTSCDQDDEHCEACSGNGSYTYRVPISWTTIKEIYAMAVERLGEQQEPLTCGIVGVGKTLDSMIFEAEEKMELWNEIAIDEQALVDRNKTREEAIVLANYFEGKFDSLCDVRSGGLA